MFSFRRAWPIPLQSLLSTSSDTVYHFFQLTPCFLFYLQHVRTILIHLQYSWPCFPSPWSHFCLRFGNPNPVCNVLIFAPSPPLVCISSSCVPTRQEQKRKTTEEVHIRIKEGPGQESASGSVRWTCFLNGPAESKSRNKKYTMNAHLFLMLLYFFKNRTCSRLLCPWGTSVFMENLQHPRKWCLSIILVLLVFLYLPENNKNNTKLNIYIC